MGKFDGILICTDLDGTLYRNDKTISDENKAAVEYFKSEGGLFTFITGRMPDYSEEAYMAASPNVPFGCINGGGVYDGEAKKYVWTCEMNKSVFTLLDYVDEQYPDVAIQVCTFDRTYFSKENHLSDKFRKITGVPKIMSHYRDIKEPIAKIILMTDDDDKMSQMARAIKEQPNAEKFDFTRSSRTLFEILPKGVNKGLALEKLVEYLGIDPNKTVAIGDFDNDVGMLRAAKLGVAVANASEMARNAADVITVSNEEHAIARVIYDIENGKYNI